MQSDEELMRAYVRGDAPAFRALFDRYAPLLRRVFLRRVRAPELADDLVQQTFLQLHRARNDFDEGALLRPWLMTIALNLYREQYRRNARHPEPVVEPVGAAEPRQSTPDQDRADLRRDLASALEQLPAEQREVVVLRWIEGLSFLEIAEIVGASHGAVRVRAHRAVASLRGLLDLDGNESQAADIHKGER